MHILQLQVPNFININPEELMMILASRLYEQGMISIGQAAEMVGLSKRTFMELLGRYNVSVLNYDEEALERDVKNA